MWHVFDIYFFYFLTKISSLFVKLALWGSGRNWLLGDAVSPSNFPTGEQAYNNHKMPLERALVNCFYSGAARYAKWMKPSHARSSRFFLLPFVWAVFSMIPEWSALCRFSVILFFLGINFLVARCLVSLGRASWHAGDLRCRVSRIADDQKNVITIKTCSRFSFATRNFDLIL